MLSTHGPEVRLTVQGHRAFLPVVTAAVEKASLAFGMDEPESLALTLATEEIFAYLCSSHPGESPIEIRCTRGPYYVQEEVLFRDRELSMRAFNLTACPVLDEAGVCEETGLLIASRMVDQFRMARDEAGFHLTLIKEKSYPVFGASVVEAPRLEKYSVRAPDPEEIKLLVRLTHHYHPTLLLPPAFSFPGKVVDMAAGGHICALVAADSAAHVGGGIFWREAGSGMIELFGPYLFDQRPDSGIGSALVDGCIGAIARTDATGLLCRYPSPDLPSEYFEDLGNLSYREKDGTDVEVGAYFRLLHEDPGSMVWTHPSLESFLAREYRRLVLAREVRVATWEGEAASPFSVLLAEFDRSRGHVTLRPVWWGDDSEDTVRGYVDILTKEGIPGVFFEMDLGRPWHSHFAPALLHNGFEPRLLLPYGGRGDVVVFQHMPDRPLP